MVNQVKIYDLDIEYETVYRNVKYPRLEFKTGDLLLVLPINYEDPESLIQKHKNWIYKRYSLIETSLKDAQEKIPEERTDEVFRNLVRSIVENISKELKLNMNKIYFRRMRSKWGSCSSKKNLTINTYLKYLPENLIEYIIFHEMVHLIERKHNKAFWNIISKRFNDYQRNEKELLAYWFLIQKVVTNKNTKVHKRFKVAKYRV